MTHTPRIVYRARDEATPEAEVSALANIYRFVLDRTHKNAPAVTSTRGDGTKGSRHEVRANKASIPPQIL
jgi:hypothetical protein